MGIQPSKRASARPLAAEDAELASAWSQVAPAIRDFHVGQLEHGGDCILLTAAPADPGGPELRWLIWPEGGRFVTQFGAVRTAHRSMHDALQHVAPLSETELRSVTLLTTAMLQYRRALAASDAPHALAA